MKALVDRIDWANCLKCKYACDGCVTYAHDAAKFEEIGCEHLVISDDKKVSDSHAGTIPLSS